MMASPVQQPLSPRKPSRTTTGFGRVDLMGSGSIRQPEGTRRALQVYSFFKQQIHTYLQAIGHSIPSETADQLNQRQQAALVKQKVDATRNFARYLGTSVQQLHESDISVQVNPQVPAQTIDSTYRLWLIYRQAQIAAGIEPPDIPSVQVKTSKYRCKLSPKGIQIAINTGTGFTPACRVDQFGKGEITAGIRLQDLQAICQNAQRSAADWISKYTNYLNQSFAVGLDHAIRLYEQQKDSFSPNTPPTEIEAVPATVNQTILVNRQGQSITQSPQPIASPIHQSIVPQAAVVNLYPTPVAQSNLKGQPVHQPTQVGTPVGAAIQPSASASASAPQPIADVVINLYPTPVVNRTQLNQSSSGVGNSTPQANQPQPNAAVRASLPQQQPDPVNPIPPVPKGPEFWKQAGRWAARLPNPFRDGTEPVPQSVPQPSLQQIALVSHPDYPALSQALESLSSQYRAIFTHQDRSYTYRLGEYEVYISSQAGGKQGMISIKQDGQVIAATDPYTLNLSRADFSSLNMPHLLSRLQQFEGFLKHEQKIIAQEVQLSRVAQVSQPLTDLNRTYRERFGNQSFELSGRDFTVSFDAKGAISITRKGEQVPAVSISARGEITSGGALLSQSEVEQIKQAVATTAQNWRQQVPVLDPQAHSKPAGR